VFLEKNSVGMYGQPFEDLDTGLNY
jgi:hypothetical protein